MSRPRRRPFVIPAGELAPARPPPRPTRRRRPTTSRAARRCGRSTRLAARRRRGGLFWTVLASLLTLVVSVAAYDYLTGAARALPAPRHARAGAHRRSWRCSSSSRSSANSGPSAASPASTASAPRRPPPMSPPTAAAALALSRAARRLLRRPRRAALGRASASRRPATPCSTPTRSSSSTERTLLAPLDAAGPARDRGRRAAPSPAPPRSSRWRWSTCSRRSRRTSAWSAASPRSTARTRASSARWRLLRMVAAHLLATGAVAVGDDMIGSVAGGHWSPGYPAASARAWSTAR